MVQDGLETDRVEPLDAFREDINIGHYQPLVTGFQLDRIATLK